MHASQTWAYPTHFTPHQGDDFRPCLWSYSPAFVQRTMLYTASYVPTATILYCIGSLYAAPYQSILTGICYRQVGIVKLLMVLAYIVASNLVNCGPGGCGTCSSSKSLHTYSPMFVMVDTKFMHACFYCNSCQYLLLYYRAKSYLESSYVFHRISHCYHIITLPLYVYIVVSLLSHCCLVIITLVAQY